MRPEDVTPLSPEDARAGAAPRDAGVPWLPLAVFAAAAALSLRHGQDFEVFWRAARRFPLGEDLFPGTDGFLEWRYLPATALLFLPIAVLPLAPARIAWFAVLVAAGTASVALLTREHGGRRSAATVALALAIVSRPILEEFAAGQANLPVLLALLLAIRDMDRGREVRAGLLVALAIGMKITPAVLLADAALRRRWRVLAGAGAGLLALVALAIPFYGVAGSAELHRAWITAQLRVSASLIPAAGNQSIFAAVARTNGPTWLALAGAAGIVLVAVVARPGARRPLLLLTTAIASPLGWIQNYVFALPAAMRVAEGRHRRVAAALGIVLLGVIHDVAGPRLERWTFTRSLPLALGVALFVAALAGGPPPGRAGAPRARPPCARRAGVE